MLNIAATVPPLGAASGVFWEEQARRAFFRTGFQKKGARYARVYDSHRQLLRFFR